jgi:hypothetical protein
MAWVTAEARERAGVGADILVRSFEDRFDPAIGKVAYPSGHAAALGQPTAGVAEEDALDPARDQYPIANHKHTVQSRGRA